MGLDVYAGPVSRYAGGAWATVMEQAGGGAGIPVVTIRADQPLGEQLDRALQRMTAGEPAAPFQAPGPVPSLGPWQAEVMRRLGVQEAWTDDPSGEFLSDQPGWWGYGAVLLLASYDDQPTLAPGARVRRLLGSRTVQAVAPAEFSQAEAFKAASQAPVRYPTLLRAQWCVPLSGGPILFAAPTPAGNEVTMGHVDRLLAELVTLNERTLRLSEADLVRARRNETEPDINSFEAMAPFGLGVLMATARFAAEHRVAWILDY